MRKPRTRLHDCLQTTETRETRPDPTGWAAPAPDACTVQLQGQFLHKVCVVLQPPQEVLTGITPSAISDGSLPHGGAAVLSQRVSLTKLEILRSSELIVPEPF